MSRRQTLAPGGATMATRETTSRVVKYSSTDDQVWKETTSNLKNCQIFLEGCKHFTYMWKKEILYVLCCLSIIALLFKFTALFLIHTTENM